MSAPIPSTHKDDVFFPSKIVSRIFLASPARRISFHLLNELYKMPRIQLSLQLECVMCANHVISLIVFVSTFSVCDRLFCFSSRNVSCTPNIWMGSENIVIVRVCHLHAYIRVASFFPYAQELHQINDNISSRKFTGWQLVYDFPSDKYVTSKSSSVNISNETKY